MVTSRIYSEELPAGHEQAVSRNSSKEMFVWSCRCADRSVCQKGEKIEEGGEVWKEVEREYSVTFKVLISGSQPLI